MQGFHASETSEGMSLMTTLPAPIALRFPIVIPGHITTLPPIQTSLPDNYRFFKLKP
ncbi:hypothetical protein CHISP_1813 [Chitinispirillum alkaliphilum]|nr:hypothetical protein CHISP_1813 [Chitinispirillum alkaliphilum]